MTLMILKVEKRPCYAHTTNGSHTLSAAARDAAGNQTTATSRTVTVSNAIPDTTPPAAPTGLGIQ